MHIIPIDTLNAIAWLMTALAVGLTIGRFSIHFQNSKRMRWDDIFNGAAAIILIAYVTTYQVYMPTEYHEQMYVMGLTDKPPRERDPVMNAKLNVANLFLFWLVIYVVKVSFLALYWEIFEISAGFRIAWVITAVYTALSFAVTWLSILWRCGMPKDVVNINACNTRPISRPIHMTFMWCALNAFGDILLMVLPIAMLRSMMMHISQKVALAFVFGLVTISIIFDILRTIYTASTNLANTPDLSLLWTLLQPTIAVIACALPCYRGLLLRGKFRSLVPSSNGSRHV